MEKRAEDSTSGIITARLVVVGRVDVRPAGWSCNGSRFLKEVRSVIKSLVDTGVPPLRTDVILLPGYDRKAKQRWLTAMESKPFRDTVSFTVLDEVTYRWQLERKLSNMGRRSVNLEVVEDGLRENIFQTFKYNERNTGVQDNAVAASTVGGSSTSSVACETRPSFLAGYSSPSTEELASEQESLFSSCCSVM